MRTVLTASLCVLLWSAHAAAQSEVPTVPVAAVPAGRAKSADASLGFSYLSHTASPSNRIGLDGVDASLTIGLNSRLGVRGDLGYAWTGNAFGTPSHSSVFSYMAGPVFYPTSQRHVRTYLQALLGGARVSDPIPVSGGILIGGWATQFAWAVGGGMDFLVSDSIGFRAGVDYMRTAYFGPSLAIQEQNNVRATAAVVYFFGAQSRRRR
jgi:opacity protein-like surface antigen